MGAEILNYACIYDNMLYMQSCVMVCIILTVYYIIWINAVHMCNDVCAVTQTYAIAYTSVYNIMSIKLSTHTLLLGVYMRTGLCRGVVS